MCNLTGSRPVAAPNSTPPGYYQPGGFLRSRGYGSSLRASGTRRQLGFSSTGHASLPIDRVLLDAAMTPGSFHDQPDCLYDEFGPFEMKIMRAVPSDNVRAVSR